MTPKQLRDRFRREMDDRLGDAADDSAALYQDEDIFDYLNDALLQFVHDTRYLTAKVQIPVVANLQSSPIPDHVIELRENTAYLQTYDVHITERSYSELAVASDDDYGTKVNAGALGSTAVGRPRHFTFDIEANKVSFFPTPDANDILVMVAYVEAKPLESWDEKLPIQNPRHARMLLNGMKHFAFGNLDAEVYNPNQENLFGERFERDIALVAGERDRRRRDPQPIQYGGIP